MEGISDIKIVGIDEMRPPKIRKEPYIDLYFKLSHQAPADWCNDFNALMAKYPSSPNIDTKVGLFIETWVRKPEEIAALLEKLKEKISECSREYIKRVERSIRSANDSNIAMAQAGGEQDRLNRIIAELDFSDIQTL